MINSPGVNEFIDLKDAPNSYSGQASKVVKVNAGETAVEFGVGGGGSGTVTDVSVVTANGVSGSVATSTTTPAITLTLGAITPTSVNSIVFSGASTPTLSVTGTSSISGSNTGDNATNTQYSGLASSKQDTLVSGTNIKTVNGSTLLGSGDLVVSGAVSDGDKGDITVTASGATWTIDNGVVTAAKTSITGTPDGTKYLRDDFSWQTVAGGSGLTALQVFSAVSIRM